MSDLVGDELIRITDDLWRLRAPNPSLMTGRGTNTWLLDLDGSWLVLDPGPVSPTHTHAINSFCDSNIATIVVTHTHEDHSPGVASLLAATSSTPAVVGKRLAQSSIDTVEHHDVSFAPTVAFDDLMVLDLGQGRTLEAIATPGHASNHVCWLLRRSGTADVLFSGDHIMDGSTVVIPPPDGDMSAYLASLDRVGALGAQQIAPGHGNVIADPAARIESYIQHRLRRESSLLERTVGAGVDGMTIDDLVQREYATLEPNLATAAKYTIWAHLRRLVELGAIECLDQSSLETRRTHQELFASVRWRVQS